MALIPRNSLFDIDRLISDQLPGAANRDSSGFFAPRVDIREAGDHYEITAELPGVAKEDIHIHVDDGILTLEAESRQEDKEEKDGRIIRQERHYGKFMRSFNLGGDVREEDISATFRDGVLQLKAPKLGEQAPVRRRIEIG
jgi:HSP20 family protein